MKKVIICRGHLKINTRNYFCISFFLDRWWSQEGQGWSRAWLAWAAAPHIQPGRWLRHDLDTKQFYATFGDLFKQ